MRFTDEVINYVYDKNDGYCSYCEKKLAFVNYGKPRKQGAWHIEHSNPRIRGGSDYLRNLVPACINCNMDKFTLKGGYYKKKFKPKTLGGKVVDFFGLSPGTLGASRRRTRK